MKVRDILPSYYVDIEVRTNLPEDFLYEDDTLFGFCHWTGTELISDDGDNYYLDDDVYKYELNEEKKELTYWIVSEWI